MDTAIFFEMDTAIFFTTNTGVFRPAHETPAPRREKKPVAPWNGRILLLVEISEDMCQPVLANIVHLGGSINGGTLAIIYIMVF